MLLREFRSSPLYIKHCSTKAEQRLCMRNKSNDVLRRVLKENKRVNIEGSFIVLSRGERRVERHGSGDVQSGSRPCRTV